MYAFPAYEEKEPLLPTGGLRRDSPLERETMQLSYARLPRGAIFSPAYAHARTHARTQIDAGVAYKTEKATGICVELRVFRCTRENGTATENEQVLYGE